MTGLFIAAAVLQGLGILSVIGDSRLSDPARVIATVIAAFILAVLVQGAIAL
jgi:hypothetical protein